MLTAALVPPTVFPPTIVKRFFIKSINMGTKHKEGILETPKGPVWGLGLQANAWFA